MNRCVQSAPSGGPGRFMVSVPVTVAPGFHSVVGWLARLSGAGGGSSARGLLAARGFDPFFVFALSFDTCYAIKTCSSDLITKKCNRSSFITAYVNHKPPYIWPEKS